MAQSPPPASDLPYQVPANLVSHLDFHARVLRIAYRGQFDVTASVLDLPLSLVKQLGGQVAVMEGRLEQKDPTN